MWLTSSSVGRKFIMSITGICLVLFVTFHCLMNSVAIVWPTAYNVICEFLGANWYALIASLGLAVLFIIHICYAVCLTLQNRKARGNDRYAVTSRPKNVEWSSQNMLVLGIVILAFLVVHLIQFWAKMQLVDIRGAHEAIPAAAGTLFIQEAFSLVWTPIVYIIGFVALWFHMNHGFWSMFQSIGWDSTEWIERWKKIGCWWTTIVVGLFIAQAIVFTVQSHKRHYTENEALREQYTAMAVNELTDIFGDGIKNANYEALHAFTSQVAAQPQMAMMQLQMQTGIEPSVMAERLVSLAEFFNYLDPQNPIDTSVLTEIANGKMDNMPQMNPMMMGAPAPQQAAPEAQQQQAPEAQQAPVSPEQAEADNAPATEPTNK